MLLGGGDWGCVSYRCTAAFGLGRHSLIYQHVAGGVVVDDLCSLCHHLLLSDNFISVIYDIYNMPRHTTLAGII